MEVDDAVKFRTEQLIAAAKALVECTDGLCNNHSKKRFSVMVYFDESHTLHNLKERFDPNRPRSNAYFALMGVLASLKDERIFFVFLSTNSRPNGFAPVDVVYPSSRVRGGAPLIPPFFELPFDTFYCNGGLDSALTLEKACTLEHIAKAGRLM